MSQSRTTLHTKRYAARSLYISYDGLLDPLGSSQILPYLRKIAPVEDQLHVLTFEKRHRMSAGVHSMRDELSRYGISWTPLTFTPFLGTLGKAYDLIRMHLHAFFISCHLKPSLVHARGHSPAQVGLFLKCLFNSKLLFDFRGLWVDERVDKGSWDLQKPLDKLQYQCFKGLERLLLRRADHIVVLTQSVVQEVLRLGGARPDRITVIPCCADFSHFKLANASLRLSARNLLGLKHDSLVLGYLGSVGRMYLSDRFMRLLSYVASTGYSFQVLVLTPDVDQFHKIVETYLPESLYSSFRIISANRQQVSQWLPAMDLLVSFILPSYARMGASPTKLAEAWACGIPSICNSGVGDVPRLVSDLNAGTVVDASIDDELIRAVTLIPSLLQLGGERLRRAAEACLSLDVAGACYQEIYQSLRI